ncbi:response regulator [Halegenticoccus soli]|uniref:response regulator n=1 Tax=Halegenticoccus soli TaxID=1985678 RepID=UPI000C6EAF43|nr:response regulator [Halegenticoccus soli]
MGDDPTILIVEDEPQLAEMYAEWLAETYTVEVAYNGREALDRLSESEGTDVVLLDRLLPDVPGEKVLRRIRTQGLDCRVAVVTAVEPDIDIIEMGFDDYLVKPVFEADLYHVVETLLVRSTDNEELREYHALTGKRTVLEAELPRTELESNEQYRKLSQDATELEQRLRGARAERAMQESADAVFRRLARRIRTGAEDDYIAE